MMINEPGIYMGEMLIEPLLYLDDDDFEVIKKYTPGEVVSVLGNDYLVYSRDLSIPKIKNKHAIKMVIHVEPME